MDKSELAKTIRMAVNSDRDAVEIFIVHFMPLINSRSIIRGRIDIDLHQYLIMCVIERLPKSRIS